MRRLIARTRDWFRRRRLVAAMEEELAFHLEELTAEYERRGLSPDVARQAARRELGNTTRVREELRAQAGWPFLEELGRDLWWALRGLGRRPAFTGGIVAVLAVGVGAAATLLALVDAVFLRPLPVPAPQEIHLVRAADGSAAFFSAGTARRLAERLPPGAALAAHAAQSSATVQRGAGTAERVEIQLVDGGFFPALQLGPLAGRLLVPADDRIGTPGFVAVAGETWAEERFGQASAAVGQVVRVNGESVTIVGVAPKAFAGVVVGQRVQLWLPAALQPALRISGNAWVFSGDDRPNDPDWNREERVSWIHLLIRWPHGAPQALMPEINEADRPAREDIAKQISDSTDLAGIGRPSWTVEPAPTGYSHFRSSFGSTSRILGIITAALLLLTGANVSNLLMVRTLARHRELGVRLALGSGRWRVARLALSEALVLALLGVLGGAVVASWLIPLGARILAPGQELDPELIRTGPLLGLGLLGGVLTMAFAWAPAALIARLDPLVALSGRVAVMRAPVRLGRMLVVVQMAIAVVLVTVAVSLTRELQRTLTADPGFERHSVLTATFDPSAAGYAFEEVPALCERIQLALRGLPGVQAVGFSAHGILSGSTNRSGVYPRGDDVQVRFGHFQSDQVWPGYFEATGLSLLHGREILASDTAEAPHVAVVTERFARALFGEIAPLGRRFGFGSEPDDQDWTIVGVVGDVRVNAVSEDPPAMFFIPAMQAGQRAGFLAVRTEGAVETLAAPVRATLAELEPAIVWHRWLTLEERIATDLRGSLMTSRLVATLSLVALLLAALGMGAVLAHLVTLRRREIAIRLALGADQPGILRQILLDAWKLAGLGALAGAVLLALTAQLPVLRGWLPAWDVVAAIAAVLAAGLAATVGAWRPARGASQIQPNRLLTAE